MARPIPAPRPALSATAYRCLDRQVREALDLAVTCRMLSESFRSAEDPLMAVALARLSAELSDQVAVLLPVTDPGTEEPLPPEPAPPSLPGGWDPETYVAELGVRLAHVALVAQSDAMVPGLETPVAALLQAIAALYRTRRELLLLCTLVGSK
jgi:hypothetical protein